MTQRGLAEPEEDEACTFGFRTGPLLFIYKLSRSPLDRKTLQVKLDALEALLILGNKISNFNFTMAEKSDKRLLMFMYIEMVNLNSARGARMMI